MTKTNYKTTKAQMFTAIIEYLNSVETDDSQFLAERSEWIERLNHEIELVSKKSTSKANAEKVALNEKLTDLIIEVLSDGQARTVSEIQTTNAELSLANGISNSKVTSLLTALVKSGKAVRVVDKKKSYYSLA